MSGPIPIALCGKNPNIASPFMEAIAKSGGGEFEVTQVVHSLETALTAIPQILRGEQTQTSGLTPASYKDGKPAIPAAIVIGKGFSEDEMDQIVRAGQAVGQQTAWLLPDDEKITLWMKAKVVGTAGAQVPTMVADRVVDCLREKKVGREGGETGRIGF